MRYVPAIVILLISLIVLFTGCQTPEDIHNCVAYCTNKSMQYNDSHVYRYYVGRPQHLICECKTVFKAFD